MLAGKALLALVVLGLLIALKPDLMRTIVVFLVILGVLVFVHEWGHFQFGRWAGMKINRFAIGFPPWVFTKNYKGIDYSIGALPLGGMVDIAGLGSEEEMVAAGKDRVAAGSGQETADGARVVP
jgi:regulator of sigma E protease